VFSYVCWAAPSNIPVNQLFGVRSGMGMGVLTFDWSQISWIGSPLMSESVFSFCAFSILLPPVKLAIGGWISLLVFSKSIALFLVAL
jgi:hypothetical protein